MKQSDCPIYPDFDSRPIKHRITKLFWIISPAFTRWAESHMNEKDLTPQRFQLLGSLMNKGPMMMSALKDELGVSATSITALVDALEKEKMVTRKPHSTDRRATMIAITTKAEKRMIENYGKFSDNVGELFSGFSKAKEEQLLALLIEVREALIERDVLQACELNPHAKNKKKRGA